MLGEEKSVDEDESDVVNREFSSVPEHYSATEPIPQPQKKDLLLTPLAEEVLRAIESFPDTEVPRNQDIIRRIRQRGVINKIRASDVNRTLHDLKHRSILRYAESKDKKDKHWSIVK